MSHHVLMQTAKCIVAAAADFIKTGRTVQGISIEGRWDPVLAGQRRYDVAVAAPRIPLNSSILCRWKPGPPRC